VRFGFFLGAAFQIQDDVLNLAGDEKKYGKELNGDLWEGKRTLILLHLLRQASERERERLAPFLAQARSERAEGDILWVRERIETYGSIEYAKAVAHGLVGAALHEWAACGAALPTSRDRDFLEALPEWVLARN
jgi:geranylgeranyl diphosphate synthase type II